MEPTPPVAPPGWPDEVRPPGTPEWERTAVAWLLDQCPPEYRGHRAVRAQPLVLARFAVHHLEACLEACRHAINGARTDLRGLEHVGLDRDAVDAAVAAWMFEGARLTGVRRAVGLVEDALRGRRFVAHLCRGARAATGPSVGSTGVTRIVSHLSAADAVADAGADVDADAGDR